MKNDLTCPICCEPTVGLSPISKLTERGRFNWESDSTMKLLGWEKAEVQLRFCTKCFHSSIFPKFDAAQLYGERGYRIRREVFRSYFPSKEYGSKGKTFNLHKDMLSMSQDFLRLHQTTQFISKSTEAVFREIEEIRILDWGGGDGYISSVYGFILSAITGLPNRTIVFDYTDWENGESNKVGMEDLKTMEPFHIIICSHVLEHTFDPVNTIKSALSFCKDKGLLICEVPDERHNIIRALLGRKYGLNYHVNHFSRRGLHIVLEKSGLSNINTVYQGNSSYRGNNANCIVGMAQMASSLEKKKSRQTVAEETISLLLFSAKKVILEILSLIRNSRCNCFNCMRRC